MQNIKLIISIILIVFSYNSFSQELMGTIKEVNGNTLPFVSIWCSDHSKGVSSNENGEYKLNLSPGKHHLEFRMIGYKTIQDEILIHENQILKKDIILNQIEYNLKNVEILALNEDPAIWIMKKAIALAPFHLNMIESYEFSHYLKFRLIVDTVKGVFSKTYYKGLELDTIRKGRLPGNIISLMETVENVKFSKPNNYKREIIGAKNSNTGFFRFDSTNHLLALDLNVYQEKIGNVFSPLHPNAFNLYIFEYENTFKNNNELIHRIKVIPKKSSSEYFNGFIDITDNESMVVGIQLDTKINIIDLKLNIDFVKLEGLYVPIRSFFNGEITFWGAKARFLYLDEIKNMNLKTDSDFIIQPKLFDDRIYKDRAKEMRSIKFDNKNKAKEILNDEISINKLNEGFEYLKKSNSNNFLSNKFVLEFKRDSNMMKRKEEFWDEYRGNLVNSIELESYALNDTIYEKKFEKRTKDSLNFFSKKFKTIHLFTGRTYKYENSKLVLRKLNNEITAVDHFYLKTGIRYEINSNSNKSLMYYFDTGLRYSYGQNFTGFTQFIGINHSGKKDFYQIGIGDNILPFYENISVDYNPSSRIKIYTISDNYFYRKRFLNFFLKKSLSNNFILFSGFEYRNRIELENSINIFPILKVPLSPNNKLNREIESNYSHFVSHYQNLFFLNLNYYFKYKENIINGKKSLNYRNSPNFYLNFYQAGKTGGFQKIKLGFQSYLEATSMGNFNFDIQYNHFLRSPKYWLDYQHFNVNNRYFAFFNSENNYSGDFQFFHLRPFYFDTKENIFLGKLEWRPRKFLITQINNLNLLNFNEVFKYSFFKQFGRFNDFYSEITYGINRNFGPLSGIQFSYPFSKLVDQKFKVQLTFSF